MVTLRKDRDQTQVLPDESDGGERPALIIMEKKTKGCGKTFNLEVDFNPDSTIDRSPVLVCGEEGNLCPECDKPQKKEIEFQPYRYTVDKNLDAVYDFVCKGSQKNPYEVRILVDELADNKVLKAACQCKDCEIRKRICKHIKACEEYLLTESIELNLEEAEIGWQEQ